MRELTSKQFGAIGEKAAVVYLRKNGYKILNKNYTTKIGEIDIIASKGDVLAFVEVKSRSASPLVRGAFAVDTRKREHIMRVASLYLMSRKTDLQPRFDIIEVEIVRSEGKVVAVNHFKGAYEQKTPYARY